MPPAARNTTIAATVTLVFSDPDKVLLWSNPRPLYHHQRAHKVCHCITQYCAHMASTVHDAAFCSLEGVETTHLQCTGFTMCLPHVGCGGTMVPAAAQGLLDRAVVGCLLQYL